MSKVTMTITEALAELKTIDKRIQSTRAFVEANLYRQNLLKDQLEKEGGAKKVLAEKLQSIRDLEERKVGIRVAIAEANARTPVTVVGETRSIAEWLVWRRDVLPARKQWLTGIKSRIDAVKREAGNKQLMVTVNSASENPNDIVLNVSEMDVVKAFESLDIIEGTLDGQLSLKNATVTVDV